MMDAHMPERDQAMSAHTPGLVVTQDNGMTISGVMKCGCRWFIDAADAVSALHEQGGPTKKPADHGINYCLLHAAAPALFRELGDMLEAQICGPCIVCEKARTALTLAGARL